MNVALNKMDTSVIVHKLDFLELLVSFLLPETRGFSKSIDRLFDTPYSVGLDNIHLHQNWRWGDENSIVVTALACTEQLYWG